MLIKIKRQQDAASVPYWQSFQCDTTLDMTVSALLDKLNYTDDLYDIEGNAAPPYSLGMQLFTKNVRCLRDGNKWNSQACVCDFSA